MKSVIESVLLGTCVGIMLSAIFIALTGPVQAQSAYDLTLGTAFAFEQVTVSTVAVGLTAATLSPTNAPAAKSAFCTVETNGIRIRESGTPTAAIGHPKAAGAEFVVQGVNNLLNLKAIRSGGADATLTCTYYR